MTVKPYAYRFTAQFSALRDSDLGLYYWTNTYYWRSDHANPHSGPEANILRQVALNSVSEACKVDLTRIESEFGTGTFISEIAFPVTGHIPGSDRCLLVDSVRLYELNPPRREWYKRLRGLLGPADVARGRVSDDIISWLFTYVVPQLSTLDLRDYRDRSVGEIAIKPTVRTWQLRHGTKRSARKVLEPLS